MPAFAAPARQDIHQLAFIIILPQAVRNVAVFASGGLDSAPGRPSETLCHQDSVPGDRFAPQAVIERGRLAFHAEPQAARGARVCRCETPSLAPPRQPLL